MKPLKLMLVLGLFAANPLLAREVNDDDSTGMPGDNFSLEGAIELFRKAETPEAFEQMLNTENNAVNNLDLNGDGNIDYIRVEDKSDGSTHAFVLQVPVNENESQDIAVIEIEKTGDSSAVLQIVGDEDLYGEKVYAEPYTEQETGGKGGPSHDVTTVRVVVNVWAWPCVRFVYGPRYRVWVSPWRWSYYPVWFRPWHPHPWGWHHARCAAYRNHCHFVSTHRVVHAHRVYSPGRRTSVTVRTHYGPHGGVKSRTIIRSGPAHGPRGGHGGGRGGHGGHGGGHGGRHR